MYIFVGRIPMRQLVYRVHALPQSLLPLVWDFGQLNADVERLYIKQIVNRYVSSRLICSIYIVHRFADPWSNRAMNGEVV